MADGVPLLQDRCRFQHGVLIGRVGQARGQERLAPIWLENRAARPVERIIWVRVDGDDLAMLLRFADDERNQFLVDKPLGVILDDDGVVGENVRAEAVEKPALAVGVEWLARFVVDPDDLLLVLDLEMVVKLARDRADARLVRRGAQRRLADAVRGDVFGGKQLHQMPARFVLADDAGETRLCAQAGQVARHIGRAARIGRAPLDIDHRHRGLGRNAGDFAPKKLVQHQVADDENLAARECPQELRQPLR